MLLKIGVNNQNDETGVEKLSDENGLAYYTHLFTNCVEANPVNEVNYD